MNKISSFLKRIPWSLVALVVGAMSFMAGVADNTHDNLGAGFGMILGALAYRSAKKRKLGTVKNSMIRKILEIASICLIFAAVLFQNDLPNRLVTNPVSNIMIPLWAIIAYSGVRKGRIASTEDQDRDNAKNRGSQVDK